MRRRDRQKGALQTRLRAQGQKLRRLASTRSETLSAKGKLQDQDASFELARKKGGKQLSKQGQLALALRRNLSNAAATDIGSVLLTDISGQSVNRHLSVSVYLLNFF